MAVVLTNKAIKGNDNEALVLQIAAMLDEIRFGSVELVVHDGRVVHIDKRERLRLNEQKAAV
jgi:hypothetical protein